MVILENDHIARTIKRMSLQIIEEAKGNQLLLCGLNIRGFAVATMLSEFLNKSGATDHLLRQIDADNNSPFTIPDNLNSNGVIVLIDDVVFSGLTIYRAMQKIPELTSYHKTLVAALVDRGHRRIPIHVQIKGTDAPTKLNEHIEVILKNDRPYQVVLNKK